MIVVPSNCMFACDALHCIFFLGHFEFCDEYYPIWKNQSVIFIKDSLLLYMRVCVYTLLMVCIFFLSFFSIISFVFLSFDQNVS